MSGVDAPEVVGREQLVVRLRRAEGQLRGVQRMLEDDAACPQVLTQLAAAKAAIDQVGLHLISERLRACAQSDRDDCAAEFEEAMATFMRFATLAR